MKTLLILISSILMFTGCGHKEPEVIIQKEVVVEYITPPEAFTEKIVMPTPPPKKVYLKMNYKDKEKALGIYTINLINLIHIENEKKNKLSEYIKNKQNIDKSK